MNIETGEIRQFASRDDLIRAFEAMKPQERENWVEVDSERITKKQKSRMIVLESDHRSDLAVRRDILRKQKRSARRKSKK